MALPAEEDTEAPLICGDDAAEGRWVPRDEIFSESYNLGEPTLDVIERAVKLAEQVER